MVLWTGIAVYTHNTHIMCTHAFLHSSDELSAPTIVSVTPLTSTTAKFTWTLPQGPRPFYYYIFYVSVAVNGRTEREYASSSQTSEVLTGLSEGGTYTVRVTGRGSIASASDPVIFSL